MTPERVVIAEKTRGGQGRRGGRRAIRPGFSGVDEPNDPAPRETRFNCRKNQCFRGYFDLKKFYFKIRKMIRRDTD